MVFYKKKHSSRVLRTFNNNRSVGADVGIGFIAINYMSGL